MKTKDQIRKEMKMKREGMNPLEKEIFDAAIYQHIEQNSDFQNANIVLAYMPIKNEVNIVKHIQGKTLALPRVNDDELEIYIVDELDDLEEGSFGILEPKTTCEQIAPESIELAFIPGVAFDKNNHRIGFGKGYYDRLCKALKCRKIGIAYDFQIVDEIPFESHDVPVDLLITNLK